MKRHLRRPDAPAFRFARGVPLLFSIGAACGVASCSNTSGGSGANDGGGAGGAGGSGGGGGESFTVLASGRNLPGAIAVDSASVYWIEGDGTVMQMPKGGGSPNRLASGCKSGAMALDSAHVYCGGADGSVLSIAIAGGASTVLASAQPVSDLAVDTNRVYWTTYYGLRPAGNNDVSTVAAVGLDGGTPVDLATMQRVPSSLVVDATSCYWLTLVDPASDTGTTVNRAPLVGGTPAPVASGSGASPSVGGSRNKAIALDATSVYWSELSGAIRRAPVGGGTVTTLADGQNIPGAIAVDANNLYAATVSAILKVPLRGGGAAVLVDGENAGSIALDDASVYFTNTMKGTVAKAAK